MGRGTDTNDFPVLLVYRSRAAAVDQPRRGRRALFTGFLDEVGDVEPAHGAPLEEAAQIDGHALHGELPQHVLELHDAIAAGNVQRQGQVRPVAEDLLGQVGQDPSRPGLISVRFCQAKTLRAWATFGVVTTRP